MAKQRLDYMYRKEFSAALAERTGIGGDEAEEMVSAFLALLRDAWEHGRSVCFTNFGVFELRTISEKMGRNPKTMEDYVIPKGCKPVFRPTREFRRAVSEAFRENTEQKNTEQESPGVENPEQ